MGGGPHTQELPGQVQTVGPASPRGQLRDPSIQNAEGSPVGHPPHPTWQRKGGPPQSARSAGGEVAPRLQGARLEDLLPFHLKIEIPSDVLIISIFVSTPQFWQFSPGSCGVGGRNTFFSTIFNLLLFIKLSSSFGGLKQTWTESGTTNSSETRRGLSLANWLLAALWELRVRGSGPPSSAMGGVGGAPLETPRHSGCRDP